MTDAMAALREAYELLKNLRYDGDDYTTVRAMEIADNIKSALSSAPAADGEAVANAAQEMVDYLYDNGRGWIGYTNITGRIAILGGKLRDALRVNSRSAPADNTALRECRHPDDKRMGTGSIASDGSGHMEWSCSICGHHERTEWLAKKALSAIVCPLLVSAFAVWGLVLCS